MRPEQIRAMMHLGILPEDAAVLDAFLMWGRLLDDPVLWQQRRDGALLLDVLAKLTAAEVIALRQRLDAAASVKRMTPSH